MKTWLVAEMPARGWTEATSFRAEQQTMVAYTKDNRTASVLVQAGEEARRIQLTVMTDAD